MEHEWLVARSRSPVTGHKIRRKPACKPGSVGDSHSSGPHVTMRLKRPTREPCGPHAATKIACSPIWSCSGWGLPCRGVLPPARCALTAPFHPYLCASRGGPSAVVLCGTFRRLSPPRRYLAPCPAEPGLSSTPKCSDCPAGFRWLVSGSRGKLQGVSVAKG